MQEWLLLIVVVVCGSLLSLIGGLYLIYGKKGTRRLQLAAVPFAAGALLAAAFLDLLPEAAELNPPRQVMIAALLGFIGFFILERSLSWFHHHSHNAEHGGGKNQRQTATLIAVGDTLHNFIDGLAIGAAFAVSPAIGVVSAIAIAAHEIPQEIGDFGLMLSNGMKKRSVVIVNILSALATVLGATLVYWLGDSLQLNQGILLAIAAGFFIYIAASDIIPSIHAERRKKLANIQTVILLFGIVFVGATSSLAHSFVHESHHDDQDATLRDHAGHDHDASDHSHGHDHDHDH